MSKNKESIDRFFELGIHLENRILYIGDEIEAGENLGVGPQMAERAIKAMTLFNQSPEKPVTVLLNTFGGCWWNGMAIYDVIKSSSCHVTMDVIGSGMSMGSIILQAADIRRAHKNATIMIHDGSESLNGVSPKTLEAWAVYSKNFSRKRMYDIYAERSGQPAKYWEKRSSHDYILSADEAKAEGLIDEVIL